MRRLITLLVLLALIIGGLWLGGETLMARELRKFSAQGLGFSAGQITPLRNPGRMGVALRDAEIQTAALRVTVPQATLSVLPAVPLRARLDLPTTASVDMGNGPMPLELTDPQIDARFLALSGFVPERAHISSGPMRLDDAPLADALRLDAELTTLGADAPRVAAAAYDVNWQLQGVSPSAMPQLAQIARAIDAAGPLTFTGNGRVWLDTSPTPTALAADRPPLPTGIRLEQSELRMGNVTARLIGRIEADADGRAAGVLAIYSRDAGPMLDSAAESGLIPKRALLLANTMMRSISAMPMPGETTHDPAEDPAAGTVVAPAITYPKPQEGELRLPLIFADGRMSLGPIPLGSAPRLLP
ncbi:DUF2125 domain-containing protein [Paracoccus laeviglucosivorans]|uniref:DUF2125 domain-containing protein n=1 Tax=Paracoccus laeviglucosivorans TaxID=1197861 RepID=A0A521BXN7_9RHOB|nr:DUF2125 domain-containing protein [Paracoccus laeviglucosivorans]SMO51948.1 hypothetical protein SAMN06265221_103222 [Paracoccus laeviglucosivorans]